MADRSQQTEQPTARRLEKARREGQFLSARDFVSALQFLVVVLLIAGGGREWMAGLQTTMRHLLLRAFSGPLSAPDLERLAWDISRRHLLPLAAAGLALAVATVGFRLATTGFALSLKKLRPDFSRLSPLPRIRELPRQNIPAVVQAMLLIPLFGWAVYALTLENLEGFLALPLASMETGAARLGSTVMSLLWKAAGLFLIFGAVDLFRQYGAYRRDLRMSKQEVRDESKENEGNPQIKVRIRRLQRERARRRMMQDVATATAVVVNPTHYAVALRYALDSMAAPVVVAKGKNWLALRIRQRAVEHQIPVVENPPLAQALYKSAAVGQEIPAHLYRAVAEILAYIFKVMRGR